jgi:hypothetical protein
MHYEKMQTSQEFSYLKYAGLFVLASFIFMIMQSKGIVSDYLVGVIFTGFGVLFVLALNMIFISSDLDWKLAHYAGEGQEVEEKYQSMLNSHYFQAFNSIKNKRFRVAAVFRLLPFTFVGLFTALAGVALAMKVSTDLALIAGVSSVTLLTTVIFFLARTIKKSQLVTSNGLA